MYISFEKPTLGKLKPFDTERKKPTMSLPAQPKYGRFDQLLCLRRVWVVMLAAITLIISLPVANAFQDRQTTPMGIGATADPQSAASANQAQYSKPTQAGGIQTEPAQIEPSEPVSSPSLTDYYAAEVAKFWTKHSLHYGGQSSAGYPTGLIARPNTLVIVELRPDGYKITRGYGSNLTAGVRVGSYSGKQLSPSNPDEPYWNITWSRSGKGLKPFAVYHYTAIAGFGQSTMQDGANWSQAKSRDVTTLYFYWTDPDIDPGPGLKPEILTDPRSLYLDFNLPAQWNYRHYLEPQA